MAKFLEKVKKSWKEAVKHLLKAKKQRAQQALKSLDPPRLFTSEEIQKIRTRTLNFSPEDFASLLAVSVKTVEVWESGERTPNPKALRLLELIENGTYRPKL